MEEVELHQPKEEKCKQTVVKSEEEVKFDIHEYEEDLSVDSIALKDQIATFET
jgi:hypothetical protein